VRSTLSRPICSGSVLDSLLRARDLRHLVGNLAEIAESDRGRGDVRGGIVAFELRVGAVRRRERLRLPFMIDGRRLLFFGGAHERSIDGVDAIDHIAEIFAVADRLVGREGRSR
jgi:hypothetical protein